jgi:hypothetical protein
MSTSMWNRPTSKPRRALRGRRLRLGVEGLEQRLALSFTAAVVNGQLKVSGDGAADTITLDHSGSNTIVVGKGSFADATITNGIAINAGAGGDTINIQATTKAVAIDGQGGFHTVNLGKSGNAQAILGAVTVANTGGQFRLRIDDSADSAARSANLAVNTTTGFGSVSGLTPAVVNYKSSQLQELDVLGGSGGNTFTVAGTTAMSITAIKPGTRANTINIQNTVFTGSVVVAGQGAADTVNVGLAGSVQGILGEVFVGGSSRVITVNVDDHADTVARSVTMDHEVNPDTTDITGLAPGVIKYNDVGVLTVNVKGGSGGNSFTIANTGRGEATFLNTGAGTDTVNVERTSGSLSIDAQGGTNAINVGLVGSVQSIQGKLDIVGNPNSFALQIDDSADLTARTVHMGANGGLGFIVNLAPATINYSTSAVQNLVVRGGGGGNTFTISDTLGAGGNPAAGTTLRSGNGNDTVNVQGTTAEITVDGQTGSDKVVVGLAGSVQGIKGPLVIEEFSGAHTALTIDDSADATGRTVTMSAITGKATITGLGPAAITYTQDDLTSLLVKSGSGGNKITVNGTLKNATAPLTSLRTGTGADQVTVLRTDGSIIVEGQNGADSVTVGGPNGVQSINGTLRVNNAAGTTSLSINDTGNLTHREARLDSGIGGDNKVVGKVTLLAPAEISYDFSRIRDLRIIGGGGGNTITVADTLTNSLGLFTKLESGTGNDVVNVLHTSARIDINGLGGVDTINIGHDGTARDILGAVNISGASKSIVLNVDDSKDAVQRSVTISSTIEVTPGGVGFFQGTISGLAANDVTYLPAQLKSLTVSAGFAGNTFVFSDTGPAVPTIVNTGSGIDTSFVQATSGALTLNGVNGADVLNIGAGFRTNLIKGALNITNSGGHTAINIDDSGDESTSNITLANSGSSASVSGAAPAVITYVQNDLSTLAISAGSHGNTFTVTDTPQANAGAQTILNTGSGADTVNVQRTTGPLFVNGQNGRDTVNVGLNNSVQSIKGTVNISTVSFSAINLNDQADITARTVTMETNPGANQGSVIGLAPAIFLYRLGDLSTLTVNAGSGADTVRVEGTASNGGGPASTVINSGPGNDTINVFETTGPLTVNSGAGNDVINVGDVFNTLEEIQGTVTVNGQTETDILNVKQG